MRRAIVFRDVFGLDEFNGQFVPKRVNAAFIAESLVTQFSTNVGGQSVTTEKTHVMQECARRSLAGELTFPEVVGRLAAVGVERYHADYSRQEITYYLADGDSHVVSTLMSRR